MENNVPDNVIELLSGLPLGSRLEMSELNNDIVMTQEDLVRMHDWLLIDWGNDMISDDEYEKRFIMLLDYISEHYGQ